MKRSALLVPFVGAILLGCTPAGSGEDGPPVDRVCVWVRGAPIVSDTDAAGRAVIVLPAGYTFVLSPERDLAFDHGRVVAVPPFVPLPERIDEIRQMGPEIRQVHSLRYAWSVWRDGSVHNLGGYDEFFVWTPQERSEINTYVLDGGAKWSVTYESPRALGLLEITGIDPTGLEVSFRSADGVTGSFNLKTKQWSFK